MKEKQTPNITKSKSETRQKYNFQNLIPPNRWYEVVQTGSRPSSGQFADYRYQKYKIVFSLSLSCRRFNTVLLG